MANIPNVIYEIFNEPDYETWPEVKAYSEEVIKTIRAIDPDNIILVGSPGGTRIFNCLLLILSKVIRT